MATTTKALARTAASLSSTTLYTVPTATTTVITNILIANTSGSAATATISFDGVVAIPTVALGANSIASFDVKQVLGVTKTITGLASTTSVNFHISGVEIA